MAASEPEQQRERILLIDDDPALGGYLTRVLRTRGGFDVEHEIDAAVGPDRGRVPA
jgi:ActR/RegA family two-component response regulator